MITLDMQIAGMEASVLGRPSVDDESYVVSIYEAMERAAWIDVKDALPEKDQIVLVRVPSLPGKVMSAWWDGSRWIDDDYLDPEDVTHWRYIHLPESMK